MSTPEVDAVVVDTQFSEGFDDTPTETPAVEPTEPPETPEPKFVQITETDYKSLMDAAAKVNSIEATVQSRMDQAFGKIGGLQRFVEEMRDKTPAGSPVELTDEDFAELESDYPDLAKSMRGALQKVLSKTRGTGESVNLDEIRTKIAQDLQPELETSIERKFEIKTVLKKHPDFDQTRKDPVFRNWLAQQPKEFQEELGNSWEADVIIPAFDKFKAFREEAAKATQKTEERNQQADLQRSRISAAVTPRGTGQPVTPAKNANDDFEAGFTDG